MKIKLWRNKLVPGIEFVDNAYTGHCFKPHFHDHYVILTLKKGINIGICQSQSYAVTRSDIMIINPSEIHTGSSWNSEYLNYVALYVSPSFLQHQLKIHPSISDQTVWFRNRIIREIELSRQLRKIVNDSTDEYSFTLVEDLTLLFAMLIQGRSGSEITQKGGYCHISVKRSLQYIKDNFAAPISISAFCDKEHIPYYSFIRSFHSFTGMTPGQYLINYRVEQAKKILQANGSIADACWNTGFFDPSHLHRHFKLITGMTPGQYQRRDTT